ncbi:MAG: transcriptional repressor LexA, partial [candidate division KSB1 bacterium]|nr:transcriptional repressor LexA [candidate division KSB1 bacterium]
KVKEKVGAMKKLTKKQHWVLQAITRKINRNGVPPTLEELREDLGMSSKNAVLSHLEALVKKGYIERSSKARSIRVLKRVGPEGGMTRQSESGHEIGLPLIGIVTAGTPVLAEENIERFIYVPNYLVQSKQPCFALRVRGDSMINAGIHDGDLVIVQSTQSANNGDIVVALIGNEVTVKRLVVKENQRYLKAENPNYSDIHPDQPWSLQGKVLALIRERVH